jgi:vitamin B12 transporter
VLVISQKSEHVQAFFAEVATNSELSQNGRFALGMRYNDPSEGQPATVWSASGKYSLPQGMFVRALVGTAFRLPTAEELFADDPQDERGNPNLKPERSTNVNASIGGVVGVNRLKWELIGFYRKIEDLISFDGFDPVTNQSLAENVAGEVSVHGAELALEGQLTNQLSGNLSFMVDRARQAGDLQIARVPEQQAKLSLDFHPGGAWGAGLALNYVGKVFQSVWDGREQFGNYVVADVTGRVYLDSARHQLITARLQNAFDRQYATSLGTTQRDSDGSDYTYWNLGVPRTFSIRYTYQF